MKRILLAVLLFCVLTVDAQNQKPPISYQKAVHFSPLALAQIDYTFLAGAEYRTKSNFSWVLEAGYIFASSYISDGSVDSRGSGFIVRPAARFYVNTRNSFYFQPQFFYKQVTNPRYGWLGKDAVAGVPAYQQLQDFRYRRMIWGINATAGVLVPSSRRAKTFFDFYLGFGIRHKDNKVVDEPRSVYQRAAFISRENPDQGYYPSLPGGIKLVFTLE